MIIYNVTVKVDKEVSDQWVRWMRDIHIPEVMDTGCFQSYLFSKVGSVQDPDGDTFSVQYRVNDHALLNQYLEAHAPALRESAKRAFPDRFVAFRSILEVLDQGEKP